MGSGQWSTTANYPSLPLVSQYAGMGDKISAVKYESSETSLSPVTVQQAEAVVLTRDKEVVPNAHSSPSWIVTTQLRRRH